MKIRVLKVIGVALITVTLAVSFFAIPVSAADGYTSVTFTFPMAETNYFGYALYETSFNSYSFSQYRDPAYVSDLGSYVNYEFELPSSYISNGVASAFCALVLGISKFDTLNYLTSHTVWVDPFTFTYRFDQAAGIHAYRLSLRQMDMATGVGYIIGSSDWVSFAGAASDKVNVAQTKVPIVTDYIPTGDAGLALCLDFQMEAPAQAALYLRFEVLDSAVVANYATQPNANIPSYSEPSDTDILDENSSLDQDILDSDTVQDLETNTAELFSSLDGSLLNFRDGVLFVTRCLNIYLVPGSDEDGWFHDLVQISLALGIVATLLGITGSIIGAAVKRRRD